MRPDQPPLHRGERIRIILLRESNGSDDCGRAENEKETYKPIHVQASDDGGQFIIGRDAGEWIEGSSWLAAKLRIRSQQNTRRPAALKKGRELSRNLGGKC